MLVTEVTWRCFINNHFRLNESAPMCNLVQALMSIVIKKIEDNMQPCKMLKTQGDGRGGPELDVILLRSLLFLILYYVIII